MTDKPIADMRPVELLEFIRDGLLEEAHQKGSFIAECEKYAGGHTDPAYRQRVAILQASADVWTFIIAIGRDEAARCRENRARKFPEWITQVIAQARVTLVEPEPDEADAPTAG